MTYLSAAAPIETLIVVLPTGFGGLHNEMYKFFDKAIIQKLLKK